MNQTSRKAAPAGIGDALDTLLQATEGQDKVSVNDVLEAFGRRAFGPLILVPALLLTLPTGAVPGVPLALGALIGLISVQLLIGRKRPNVPGVFAKLKFPRAALETGRDKSRKAVAALDKLIERRLDFLLRPPWLQLAALACIGLCVLLIPVEVIPFATAIPGAALIVMGLAITVHDGLAMALGLLAAAAAAFGVYLLVW
jgi:hypothetical protein